MAHSFTGATKIRKKTEEMHVINATVLIGVFMRPTELVYTLWRCVDIVAWQML